MAKWEVKAYLSAQIPPITSLQLTSLLKAIFREQKNSKRNSMARNVDPHISQPDLRYIDHPN